MTDRGEVDDEWTVNGRTLTADDLARIARIAEDDSSLIVEHRHYRGASAPTRLVFDSGDRLVEYLQSAARPGDSIWFWRFDELCRDDNAIGWGKIPNERGEVPVKGAY